MKLGELFDGDRIIATLADGKWQSPDEDLCMHLEASYGLASHCYVPLRSVLPYGCANLAAAAQGLGCNYRYTAKIESDLEKHKDHPEVKKYLQGIVH